MKTFLLSFILLIALNCLAQTSNNQKNENIKQLFKLMNQDSIILNSINSMFISGFGALPVLPSDTSVNKYQLIENISVKKIQKIKEKALFLIQTDLTTAYNNIFTDQEITELITFYKSPIGKKLMSHSIKLNNELITYACQELRNELQNVLTKEFAHN